MKNIRWMIRGHWTSRHALVDGRTGCNKAIPNTSEKESFVVTSERDIECKYCKKLYKLDQAGKR